MITTMNRMLLLLGWLLIGTTLLAQEEAKPTHEWILRKYAKLDLNALQAEQLATLEDSLNQMTISLWDKTDLLIRGTRTFLRPDQWGQLMGREKGMLEYYEGIMRKKEPEYEQRLALQRKQNEWLEDGYLRKLQRLNRKLTRDLSEEDQALRTKLQQLYQQRLDHFDQWAVTRCTKPDGTVICPNRLEYYAQQQISFKSNPDLCLYYCYRFPGASEADKEALYSGLEQLRDAYLPSDSRLRKKLEKLQQERSVAMQTIKQEMKQAAPENMVSVAPTVREQALEPAFSLLLMQE
jgi:hypothetical protein